MSNGGGSGYAISIGYDGLEHFDKEKDKSLPPEIEHMFPDYSIYPQFDFAISMTSRGCPRGCPFCIVASKEGRASVKVADVSDFWNGQPEIRILDPNITACKEKRDLMRQYLDTHAMLDFTQGLDIRLLNEDDINDINQMRLRRLHFAWDNPIDNLEDKFRMFASKFRRKSNIGMVYCLTNFEPNCSVEDHVERALCRIYKLSEMGYDPYLMIYNKPNAPQILRDMQRWCNNKIIFKRCPDFKDYTPDRKKAK